MSADISWTGSETALNNVSDDLADHESDILNPHNVTAEQTGALHESDYTPETDTHDRYTDSEARNAVDGANVDISGSAGSISGPNVTSVNGETGNVTVSALTKTEYFGGTSTTHNISNNTTLLYIQAVGGGGGGAYTDTPAPTYGGGGAGVFFPIDSDEIPDKNIDIIVGEGGEGHDDGRGDAGTDTELDFGDRTLTLEGGNGGGIGSSPNRARGGRVLLDGQKFTATKQPRGDDNIDYDDDHFNLYSGGTADDDRENAFSFYGGSIQFDSSVVNKNGGPGEGGRYTEDGEDGIVRIYEM